MTIETSNRQKRLKIELSARTTLRATVLVLLAVVPFVLSTSLVCSSRASEPASASATTTESTKAEIAERYGKLPLSFVSNEGQIDREVKFVSRGPGYDLFLTATGAVISLREPPPAADEFKPFAIKQSSNRTAQASILRLKMIGSNPEPRAEGTEQLPGKINYLIGNNPDKWRVNIPTYRKVYYTEIYPKVDMVYYENRTALEYDFIVAPGGDVRSIRFEIEGTDRMMLDDAGDLHLSVGQIG